MWLAADRLVGQTQRFGIGGRRRPGGGVALQEQIGRHLPGQVAEMLDEPGVWFLVAEHTETVEHLQAELVCGGNGGRVEVGQRLGDSPVPSAELLRRGGRQQGLQRVEVAPRGARSGRRQPGLENHQPLAHPQPQLVGGHPTEGDQHQLVEGDHPLGQVSRSERGDGVGLPRAGAGLQHCCPLRQRSGDVELGDQRGHRAASAISRGWKTRRARLPKRVGSASTPRSSATTDGSASSTSSGGCGP